MKKIISLFLLVSFVLAVLVSCGDGKDNINLTNGNNSVDSNSSVQNPSDTVSGADNSSASSDIAFSNDLLINGNSIKKYSIIRPHYNSSYLTQVQIEALRDKLNSEFGSNIRILEDVYTEQSDYEIIVGNTNRTEGHKTDNDEFYVEIKGNKVLLYGDSPHSTAMAVSEFIKLVDKGVLTDSDSFSGYYSYAIKNYDQTIYYAHVWGDDFSGIAVDESKWDVIYEEHYGKGADGNSGQNGKKAMRVPEANVVANGYLYQKQYFDDDVYYGGTIRTNNHMKFLGGYIEHSVITPDNPASWNTCWMSAVESNCLISPEIDLNENFGNPNVTDANCHVWPKAVATEEYGWKHRSFDSIMPQKSKYRLPAGDNENLNTGFHTFGFLWTKDYIAFTGDGKIYCDLNLNEEGYEDYKAAFVNVAVKVIIAASPGVGTGPKDTSVPAHWEAEKSDYVTDYIHLYQLQDGWSRIEFDY